ncbi:MAG: hypothetical protein V3U18_07365 [Alphaproteobacteria bacterium]
MSVSRASAYGIAAAVALLSATGVGQAATPAPESAETTAQAEPPIRLAPPRKRLSPRAPVEVEDQPERLGPEIRRRRGYRSAPSVQVDRLEAIDPNSVGVLDESQDGFGTDMWQGTRRSTVERLLPSLPARAKSATMRDLMRRLLLSVATVPTGPVTAPSLIARRVERLAAMGEVGAVIELLEVTPAELADETLWQARIDGLLLTNDHAGACTSVRNLIHQYQGPYWQKAFIFCQTMSGEHSQARLGAALLREGNNDDDAFFTLVDALLGESGATVESLADPTALHLAMLRSARQKLPADAAAATHPAVLRTIAVSPNVEFDMRLEAAERAEAAGVLSAGALSQIYSSITFAPDELANVLSIAEADTGSRGRAALHQAAMLQTVPTARAEVLQTAWRVARATGHYPTVVRVNLPPLLGIEPTGELMWFAADAGRALFYAGRLEEAFAWYELVAREARSPQAESGFVALWPLAQLADDDDVIPWDPAVLGAWRQAQEGEGDGWQARAAVLLSLFDALGEPIDGAEWEPLFGSPSPTYVAMPASALWHGLRAAAEELRLGETVLLALLSLGEGGPAGAHPIVLNAVTSSLRFVGLDAEARALAIEAAVAAGL